MSLKLIVNVWTIENKSKLIYFEFIVTNFISFKVIYLGILSGYSTLKGPYADHILIPKGSTGSSIFFDIKWKPIFFW